MTGLPIRWRLTLWYGAAVLAIVVVFSLATYFPYRTAAMRAFDRNLANNLDTLQNAFGAELREAEANGGPDAVRTAATEAAADFRLNRLYGRGG